MPYRRAAEIDAVREGFAWLESKAGAPAPSPVSSWGGYGYGSFVPDGPSAASDLPLYLNVVVAASLGWLNRNVGTANLHVVERTDAGDGPEIQDHAFVALMDRPNALDDFHSFFAAIDLSDVCDGTTFIVKVRNGRRGIHSLWWVPPWDVTEEPNLDRSTSAERPILRYRVTTTAGATIYPPEDVIVIKDGKDPVNPYRGLAPLKAGIRSASTIDSAEAFTRSLMVNCGAVPCMISPALPGEEIDPTNIPALQEAYRHNQTQANNGMPFFSMQGLRVDKLGLTPEEMAIDKIRDFPVSAICALIGVPAMVLGFRDSGKTYANYQVAVRSAWDNGLIPRQQRFAEAMDRQCPELIDPRKQQLKWDYTHVKALQDDENAKIEGLAKAVGKPFMTRNEARGRLHLDAIDGWDEADEEEPEPVDDSEDQHDETEDYDPEDDLGLDDEYDDSGDSSGKSAELKRGAGARRGKPRKPKPGKPGSSPSAVGGHNHGYNPNRDGTGRFASGPHAERPKTPREPGSRPATAKPPKRAASGSKEGKPTPAAAKAKSVGKLVGKEEHVYAEHAEKHLAKSVGGAHMPDNEAVDVQIPRQGGGHHGIEAKTLIRGKKQAVTMHPDAVLRKVHYAESHPNNSVHTVVMDHRDRYKGGEAAEHYSGHELYYKRGAGRYSLGSMHKAADHDELRRLIDTPDHLLPAKARGSLPKGAALGKLKVDAEKAHASRLRKDTDRKRRLREAARAEAA